MILIKPSYEICKSVSLLKDIELAARTCYKSEEKIKDDGSSAKALITNLIAKRHFAMLEFGEDAIVQMPRQAYFYALRSCTAFKYLTFTHFDNRYIVSGSVRAILEMFEHGSALAISDGLHTNISHAISSIMQALDKSKDWQYLFELSKIRDTDVFNCSNPKDLVSRSTMVKLTDLTAQERFYHESMTVKFICDRGVSHELVRHRPASFAQESTRYVNYGKGEHTTIILPSWLTEVAEEHNLLGEHSLADLEKLVATEGFDKYAKYWLMPLIVAEHSYMLLTADKAWSAQYARSVLSTSTKTEIVVKSKLSHWHNTIFKLRTAPAAHPQMRELMVPLFNEVLNDSELGALFLR